MAAVELSYCDKRRGFSLQAFTARSVTNCNDNNFDFLTLMGRKPIPCVRLIKFLFKLLLYPATIVKKVYTIFMQMYVIHRRRRRTPHKVYEYIFLKRITRAESIESCPSDQINSQFSAIIKARDTKFGMKVYVHTTYAD